MGCLRRIGCLIIVALVLCAGYVTRHRWMSYVPMVTHRQADVIAGLKWKPVMPTGPAVARAAIARLDSFDGPVFVNVAAPDFVAFALDSAVPGITDGSRLAAAAVSGGQVYVRAVVRVADLGAENVPLLGGIAEKAATIVIGGTLVVTRPGTGEWMVKEIDVDAIHVPAAAVARVAHAFAARLKRAGSTDEALAFAIPSRVADVRVRNGSVVLYKGTHK
jgi:hypothetical protein